MDSSTPSVTITSNHRSVTDCQFHTTKYNSGKQSKIKKRRTLNLLKPYTSTNIQESKRTFNEVEQFLNQEKGHMHTLPQYKITRQGLGELPPEYYDRHQSLRHWRSGDSSQAIHSVGTVRAERMLPGYQEQAQNHKSILKYTQKCQNNPTFLFWSDISTSTYYLIYSANIY